MTPCAIDIEALAQGGAGVGRHDGKVFFVPLTAPGDRIACRVVRDRGRFAEAEMLELLEPGPGRRPPPCPVFGRCGGCQWQHLDYPTQAHWKTELFAGHLQRQAGCDRTLVRPLLQAGAEWGYRSRVQLKCRQTAAGFVMGFYRQGSHFVVDVEHCPISAAPLNSALRLLRAWLAASPCPERIPQVDLAVDDHDRIRIVVHCLDQPVARLADYLRPLAGDAGFSLFLQAGRKDTLVPVCGEQGLAIEVDEPPLVLGYGPGGFAQVNLDQNRALVRELLAARPWQSHERVLDLYCGMGNFSLPLARRTAWVTGVEDYAPAIDWARRNARTNALDNILFQARPAEEALLQGPGGAVPDVVVLDPPRAGAYQDCKTLSKVGPDTIAYVSCDPATLARDLVPLLHGGYRLTWSRPVDLFPQTHHIESLSLLTRVS